MCLYLPFFVCSFLFFLISNLVLSPALWRRATVDVAVARGHATLLYDS